MNVVHHFRCFILPVLAVAVGCIATNCNSRWFRRATRVAGEEAAYTTLQAALVKAKVVSADHMVDAVRLAVDKKDYGGAAAAFAVALNEHNMRSSEKLTSASAMTPPKCLWMFRHSRNTLIAVLPQRPVHSRREAWHSCGAAPLPVQSIPVGA